MTDKDKDYFTPDIDKPKDLSDDINLVVNSLRNNALITNSSLEISDALVLSLSTDEGLYDPYGICDVRSQISYRYHLA